MPRQWPFPCLLDQLASPFVPPDEAFNASLTTFGIQGYSCYLQAGRVANF